MSHLKNKKPTPNITGIKIVGDSLSDAGRKYKEKIFGIIPYRWFLHKSKYGEFTDANVWAVYFKQELKALLENAPRPYRPIDIALVENEAEGGATLNKYRSFYDFVKWIKGFLMSFFLGSIQNQVDDLKKYNKITPEDLVINWGEANDLVTLNYMNKACVERLIKSNQLFIDKVSQPEYQSLWLHNNNHAHEVLIFELPDISCTPRFHEKKEKEKVNLKKLCERYNQGIHDLAKKNQYIDFSGCPLYSVKSLKDLCFKDEKAIIFVGEGRVRKVYFINNGQYVKRDESPLFVKHTLNKKERKIFSPNEGNKPIHIQHQQVIVDQKQPTDRVVAGHVVGEVIAKAGLNANVRIMNIAEKFSDILNNPEKYDLTVGCAILYATQTLTKEALSERPKGENAIILIPDSLKKANHYNLQIVKEGQFVLDKYLNLTLTPAQEEWVAEKLNRESDMKVLQLISGEDLHDDPATRIIVNSIKEYKKCSGDGIVLTKPYESVLELKKKNHPTQNLIFWDDLHPAKAVHKIIAKQVFEFFKEHYQLVFPKSRELEESLLKDTSIASSVSSDNYLSNETKLDTVDINPSKQQQQGAAITTAQVFTEQNLENKASYVSSNSAFFQLPPVQKEGAPIFLAAVDQPNAPPIGGCFEI